MNTFTPLEAKNGYGKRRWILKSDYGDYYENGWHQTTYGQRRNEVHPSAYRYRFLWMAEMRCGLYRVHDAWRNHLWTSKSLEIVDKSSPTKTLEINEEEFRRP